MVLTKAEGFGASRGGGGGGWRETQPLNGLLEEKTWQNRNLNPFHGSDTMALVPCERIEKKNIFLID